MVASSFGRLELRVTTDESHLRYSFDLPGCGSSFMCLPWWHSERADQVGTRPTVER